MNSDYFMQKNGSHNKITDITCTTILFVCLCFFVPLVNFQSYGDVTIAGERLQILTCDRHSWPLCSEISIIIVCHTYCDTAHPFIMVIYEDPRHRPAAERLAVELSLPVFTTVVCFGCLGFEHPTFLLRGERVNPLHHHRSHNV